MSTGLVEIDLLVEAVKAEGIHVLFYKSKTSESYYFKFDYGAANSLRASDHDGKDHLAYMFNLRSDLRGKSTKKHKSGTTMYIYGYDCLETLAKAIVLGKQQRIKFRGLEWYNEQMQVGKSKVGNGKGFWQYCQEV